MAPTSAVLTAGMPMRSTRVNALGGSLRKFTLPHTPPPLGPAWGQWVVASITAGAPPW